MLDKKTQRIDWEPFLARISGGKTVIEYALNHNIFSQGDPADSVFYLRRGKVKLAVRSKQGREAIVAIMGAGEFFGEGCLTGQLRRIATATAIADCTLVRIEKPMMVRMLHEQHDLSEVFVTHLLSRTDCWTKRSAGLHKRSAEDWGYRLRSRREALTARRAKPFRSFWRTLRGLSG